MRFYERFCSFRALCIIGKCTSRHLFAYGGLVNTLIMADFNLLLRATQGDTHRFELIKWFIKVRTLL